MENFNVSQENQKSNQNTDPAKKDFKKEFAEFFGPIMPHIRTLRNIGHFGSFLTASYAVNGILQTNFGLIGNISLITLAVFLSVSACFAIEFGISRVFPIWSRQIIRWKFHNPWFIGMFVILTLIVIPLCILSPLLSHDGGEDALQDYAIEIEAQSSDSLKNAFAAEKNEVMLSYAPRVAEIEKSFAEQKQTIKEQYKKLIQVQYDKYDHHVIKKKEGYDWAQGHMDAAVKERKRLQAKESSKLAELGSIRSSALLPLINERNTELKAITQLKVSTVAQFHAKDSTRMALLTAKQSRRVNTAGDLALVCVLLTIICILVSEFYAGASGHKYQSKEYKESTLKFKWPQMKRRINLSNWFYEKVSPATDTEDQPEPDFDIEDEANQKEFLDNQEITLIRESSSDDLIIMLRNSYARRIKTINRIKRIRHRLIADLIWEILIARGFKLKALSKTGFKIVQRPSHEILLPA